MVSTSPPTQATALAMGARRPLLPLPAPEYTTIPNWCALSGMGRSATYEALGRGDLRAVKLGTRTLIDVPLGLAWLDSRPAAVIRPHGGSRKPHVA